MTGRLLRGSVDSEKQRITMRELSTLEMAKYCDHVVGDVQSWDRVERIILRKKVGVVG